MPVCHAQFIPNEASPQTDESCFGGPIGSVDPPKYEHVQILRRWLARLPHPYTPQDRQAGYRYDLSILQAEFSSTQILDRPLSGRIFFEEIIRENLDFGAVALPAPPGCENAVHQRQ